MERVVRRIVVDAARAEVWRALTDGLSAWFGAQVTAPTFEHGAHLEFRWADGRARAAVIEHIVPEQLLAFRWLPFERDGAGVPAARETSRIEFELRDEEGRVALLVTETAMGGRAQTRTTTPVRAAVAGGAA